MSQLAISLSEWPKGALPSQPLVNPKNFSQAYEVQDSKINQCNVVHTLRSEKKVDNQIYQPKYPVQIDPTPVSTYARPSQSAPQTSDNDTATDQVFPNRLRNNNKNMHMEKILEIFNQVKLNVPLLDAIQQVPAYAKFLKDMCTEKRKMNVPKKVFLATNISELLSHPISVKYKNPECPTISFTIWQIEIGRALLDLGASINLLSLSVYRQLGLGELRPTRITIQLVDRSVKVLKGKITNVLIRVGNFNYPVDFIMLETQLCQTQGLKLLLS